MSLTKSDPVADALTAAADALGAAATALRDAVAAEQHEDGRAEEPCPVFEDAEGRLHVCI